jgi:hypothetical protein
MLSINQIVKKASQLSELHPQINSFYFGPFADIGSQGSVSYRLFAMDVMPGSLSIGLVNDRFILYFADIMNKDKSNEKEIFSDCQLIALDIFAQLYEYFQDNDIEIDPNATMSFFREATNDDEAAGCQIEISVPQFYSRDTCQVPTRGADVPDALLMENEDFLLQEDGFKILL